MRKDMTLQFGGVNSNPSDMKTQLSDVSEAVTGMKTQLAGHPGPGQRGPQEQTQGTQERK